MAASTVAMTPYPLLAVALAHTVFNVGTTLLDLPLLPVFVRVLERIIPVTADEGRRTLRHETHLDPRLSGQPMIALAEAQREIGAMGRTCRVMLADLRMVVEAGSKGARNAEEEVFALENDLDLAQKEVSEFVTRLFGAEGLSREEAVRVRRVLRQADEYESVSDYVRNALKAFLKIRNAGEELSAAALGEVEELCDKTDELLRVVACALERDDEREVPMVRVMSVGHEMYAKACRAAHLERVGDVCGSPVKSFVYLDMLVAFRRVNDHLLNIAETLKR